MFSLENAKKHRDWFTADLYQLMISDMAGPDVGYIDSDPFTQAQDDVPGFSVGEPRGVGDSVQVQVTIPATPYRDPARITVYLVQEGGEWRIANFADGNADLASGIRKEQVARDRAARRD